MDAVEHNERTSSRLPFRRLRLLREARRRLGGRVLRLAAFVVFAYLILQLVPGLENALESLKGVGWQWLLAAAGVETLSQIGYVVSWRGILDPDNLLGEIEGSRHVAAQTAWAQLGGGMLVPGGTLGSMGVGAWMLHRRDVDGRRRLAPVHPDVPQHRRRRTGDRVLRRRPRGRPVQRCQQPPAHGPAGSRDRDLARDGDLRGAPRRDGGVSSSPSSPETCLGDHHARRRRGGRRVDASWTGQHQDRARRGRLSRF